MEEQARYAGLVCQRLPHFAEVSHGLSILAGEEIILWLLALVQFRHEDPAFFRQVHNPRLTVLRFTGIEGNRVVEKIDLLAAHGLGSALRIAEQFASPESEAVGQC